MEATATEPSTVPSAPTCAFLTAHPAWVCGDEADPQDDPCAEYFNSDGSLSDAALAFLHREWITGRMI
jgi:hypothetical protein